MENNKEQKPIKYKYDDSHESSSSDIIVAEQSGTPYYIRNIKDLLNYGLQATVISYDMLETFCRIHKDTHHSYIRYLLNDRGIQLASEGDWFRVSSDYYLKEQPHGLPVRDTTGIEDCINKMNSDYQNIVFTRPEILYRALDILASQKDDIINENKITVMFNKKVIEQLLTLKILRKNVKEYIIDPGLLNLADRIKNTGRERASQEYLWSMVSLNPHIRFLLNIVKLINKKNMKSAEDILYFCYNSHYEKAFIHVFLSGKTSNGIKPILQYKDICYRCANLSDCLGVNCMELKGIRDQMLNIRNVEAIRCLREVRNTESLIPIINRPIYQKFIFSYNIVVLLKGFLRNIGILKKDKILYKDHGIYCSREDKWRLEDDFLVR